MASIVFQVIMMGISYLMQPTPPTLYGPRLTDLKVQASAYGIPVTRVFGTIRVAGNIIWATDIKETTHSTSQGGKGGPSQTSVTYTYSQSLAIGICEGVITGIRKIWANGELIYNISGSGTLDIPTIESTVALAPGIRVYTGSETQTADSLIQATMGTTPAYRGIAYVVFENLQLEKYGNRAPNIEFEVVASGSYGQPLIVISNKVITVNTPDSHCAILDGDYLYITTYNLYRFEIYDVSNPLNTVKLSSLDLSTQYAGQIYKKGNIVVVTSGIVHVIDVSNKAAPVIKYLINPDYGSPTLLNPGSPVITDYNIFICWGSWWVSYDLNTGTRLVMYNQVNNWNPETCYFDPSTNIVYTVNAGDPSSQGKLFATSLLAYSMYDITSIAVPFQWYSFGGSNHVIIRYGNYLYVSQSDTIFIISIVNSSQPILVRTIPIAYYVSGINANNNILYVTSSSSHYIYIYSLTDPTNPVLLGSFSTGIGSVPIYADDSRIRFKGSYVYIISSGFITCYLYTGNLLNSNTITLSSIVSNICLSSGLKSTDINVTALTDTVYGYATKKGTARSWIEPLMQAFNFDAVESDGKVKFVKRGGASVLSIPENDLAAHEQGTQLPDNMLSTRQQEMELPVTVTIQYMDKDVAYQTGSQMSQRYTVDSSVKKSIDLAIAMPASKAKSIADVVMYNEWTNRTSFEQQHGWKYAYLEPTDVITVTKGSTSYIVRLVDEDMAKGVYTRRAVLEDSNVYTQAASAAPMLAPTNTISGIPTTILQLMDIPLLRDGDDGYGIYVAACGSNSSWGGTQLYKSNDSGYTWNSYGNPIFSKATIGTSTSTALGNFNLDNIFDEINTVLVTLSYGTLSSDTEINILNGNNVALIGNEIIQFKNATLVYTGTYTLSGLLRGRKGTEWAMSTHVANERFILLNSVTTRLLYSPSSEYNLSRKYKAPAAGAYLDTATITTFTNTGKNMKPYACVDLGGGRDASGNITINWVRRTRIGGEWVYYSDVPNGETSLAFEVEVWNSTYTTLKRTITGLSTTTTSYTSAQQVTDFGSNQSVVYLKVYQVSSVVGRGYELKGSV